MTKSGIPCFLLGSHSASSLAFSSVYCDFGGDLEASFGGDLLVHKRTNEPRWLGLFAKISHLTLRSEILRMGGDMDMIDLFFAGENCS